MNKSIGLLARPHSNTGIGAEPGLVFSCLFYTEGELKNRHIREDRTDSASAYAYRDRNRARIGILICFTDLGSTGQERFNAP